MCPQRTVLGTDCASNPHVVFKQRIESMHEINYDRDWVAVLVWFVVSRSAECRFMRQKCSDSARWPIGENFFVYVASKCLYRSSVKTPLKIRRRFVHFLPAIPAGIWESLMDKRESSFLSKARYGGCDLQRQRANEL
jgi:hypothetical protein